MIALLTRIVIPAEAGIHEHGGSKWNENGVHGFRIKSGMTARDRAASIQMSTIMLYTVL